MRKLLASLILLIMAINILPADSSMSDGAGIEYIPPAFNLGIGYSSPTSKLHVKGTTNTNGFTMNGNSFYVTPTISQGSILFAKEPGKFATVNNGAGSNHFGLKMNGNTVAWEPLASSAAATNIEGLSDGISHTINGTLFVGSGSGVVSSGILYTTGLGIGALHKITTGQNNTAVGYQSLNGNTTGSENTALGKQALYTNSTGTNNIAIGKNSLYFNTTGSYNVAHGTASLYSNTTGADNTASGGSALNKNTTGTRNTAIGRSAIVQNVSGSYNTAVGFIAGGGAVSSSFANGTFLGSYAGQLLDTGDNNTLIGFNSGNGITTGANNITLGYLAGDNITTGSSNIIIGDSADAFSATASSQLNIGNSIYGDMSTDQISIGTTNNYGTLTIEGTLALDEATAPSSSTGYGKVYVNNADKEFYYIASDQSAVRLTNNGATVGATNINGLIDGVADASSVYLGNGGGLNQSAGNLNNTSVGFQALKTNIGGSDNLATGYKALYSNTSGVGNTAVGASTLYFNTANSNTATGFRSLYNTTTGYENTATGARSMDSNTTGYANTASGYGSLITNTTGYRNTATGHSSLYLNSTGHDNTSLGFNSLQVSTTGNYNTATGSYSLNANTVGASNTAAGYSALSGNTTGTDNVAIGKQAGLSITTGSFNIMIGSNVDAVSATATGQLNIGDSIYGDMNTDQVSIGTTNNYGTLTVEGTLALDETTAPSSATGYGKVYVNSTDKELYYTASDQSAVKLTNNGSVISASNDVTNMGLRDTARNLKIFNNGAAMTTKVNVLADEIILQNTNGDGRKVSSVSLLIDMAAAVGVNARDAGSEAASTWYHIWVIANASNTVAGLFSTSATTPTMPSGYTYKAYVGSIFNNSSSNLITIYQLGKRVTRTPLAVLNGGVATSYTSFNLANGIPLNATLVYANAGLKQTGYIWSRQGAYFKSRSSDALGEVSVISYDEAVGGYSETQGEITTAFSMPIVVSQTLYYKCFHISYYSAQGVNCDNDAPGVGAADGGGASVLFRVTGWEF